MLDIPTDMDERRALFDAISRPGSMSANIANAFLPNSSDPHSSDEVITHFRQERSKYVSAVLAGHRLFRQVLVADQE